MARYCRGDAAAFHRCTRCSRRASSPTSPACWATGPRPRTRCSSPSSRCTRRASTYVLRRQPDPVDLHHRPPHLPGRDPQAQAQPRAAQHTERRARARRARRAHHGRRRRSSIPIRPTGRTRRRAAGRAGRARQAARQPAPGVDPDQGPRPVDRRGGDDHRQHAGRDQAARAPRLRDAAPAARQGRRKPRSASSRPPRKAIADDRVHGERGWRSDRRRRPAARAVRPTWLRAVEG